MGKKMKLLPFLSQKSSSWPWPSCHQHPRTLSFRGANEGIFKTINSNYIDEETETPDSFFTSSSKSPSFSAESDDTAAEGGDSVENIIRGLKSERLFFEPEQTSSILEEVKASSALPSKQGTLFLSMESIDPFMDFRMSMKEMVEAHGLKDWGGLEELLCCYLRVNSKNNHGYIFGAFVDLFVGLAISSSSCASASASTSTSSLYCSCSHSPSCPLSFYTSSSSEDSSSTPCVSSLEAEEVDNVHCLSSSLEVEEIRDEV
ncbi:hypothetical protein SLA2020_527900 [Shorea laevis]